MFMMWIWLAVIIISIIIEILTVGLTSVWITGGAMVALAITALGGPLWLQITACFTVTFLLLYFTRPWAVKFLSRKQIRTNVEAIIGSEVRIVEEVNNHLETGKVIYNGMEWTARSLDPERIFAPDETAEVAEISGVKLIIKPLS